ncbi:MAG: hypothetical protein P8Y94_11490 [Acidobacteriota bacterium]
MNRFRTFFQTTTLGGLIVVLPVFLLFLIFRWLFRWVTDLIQPLTDVVVARVGAPEFAAKSGWKTAFIPTGPNPTTGYIVHLPGHDVFPIEVRVEDAIRSVISCGAGSASLIDAHLRNAASAGPSDHTALEQEESGC